MREPRPRRSWWRRRSRWRLCLSIHPCSSPEFLVFGAGRLSRGSDAEQEGGGYLEMIGRTENAPGIWRNLTRSVIVWHPEIVCRASCSRRKSDEENRHRGRRAVGIATGVRTPAKEVCSHGRK